MLAFSGSRLPYEVSVGKGRLMLQSLNKAEFSFTIGCMARGVCTHVVISATALCTLQVIGEPVLPRRRLRHHAINHIHALRIVLS